jgi:hypothetical protein
MVVLEMTDRRPMRQPHPLKNRKSRSIVNNDWNRAQAQLDPADCDAPA